MAAFLANEGEVKKIKEENKKINTYLIKFMHRSPIIWLSFLTNKKNLFKIQ
jgi:hypothetical protein